jgi:hypothetical protein
MNELTNFFEDRDYVNTAGFSINDYLSWDNPILENKHDYIQWIFPLNEPSVYNPNCPILDDELVKYFNNSNEIIETHKLCIEKIYKFLQLDGSQLLPFWWTINNHNSLRVSRIIKSSRLLGNSELSDKIYESVMNFNKICPMRPITVWYWNEAIK